MLLVGEAWCGRASRMLKKFAPGVRRTAAESDTKSELFNLRFAFAPGHLTDFSKIREMRRTYAQIQTVISEKRLAEEHHGAA